MEEMENGERLQGQQAKAPF
uniref:Uncharacterized protein n=1 Tax=Anguilla anguilla TaxID=7936 RepID=A0A0E9U9L7_ANGAN